MRIGVVRTYHRLNDSLECYGNIGWLGQNGLGMFDAVAMISGSRRGCKIAAHGSTIGFSVNIKSVFMKNNNQESASIDDETGTASWMSGTQ